MTISRRRFMRNAIAAGTLMASPSARLLKTVSVYGGQNKTDRYFKTRGVVLAVQDLANFNWPQMAKKAGLSTIGTHLHPVEVNTFFKTEKGYKFIQDCSDLGIEIEHELHAMNDLLPRVLYERNPEMFRMDHNGNRIKNWNLCVHSKEAIEEVCKNAVRYSKLLKSTTGRYFYWIDDARPMCKCSKCRVYSDSEQALILENAIVGALRKHGHPNAKLAHLAYMNSFNPPKQVKSEPGIFLEYAPIERRWDKPLSDLGARREGKKMTHGQHLEILDANLEVFGAKDAQVLEYWLDVSLFSNWKRNKKVKLPWSREVFLDDLKTYGSRGIRHITSFAVYIDNDYVRQFGEPPVDEYGKGLLQYRPSK